MELEEIEEGPRQPEQNVEDMLTKVLRSGKGGTKVEAPYFEGILKQKDLLDQVSDMEKYFYQEEIDDPRRVRFSYMRLKGHIGMWQEHLKKDQI